MTKEYQKYNGMTKIRDKNSPHTKERQNKVGREYLGFV